MKTLKKRVEKEWFIRTNRFHRAPASIPKKIYSEIFAKTILFVAQVSQTITRGGPRTQIAIPAQGMIEFRDALTDLLEEYGTDDGGFKGDLPEGRYMRVDSKNFYFDIGQNNRGIYMRISEVRAYRWLKIRGVSWHGWTHCSRGGFREKKEFLWTYGLFNKWSRIGTTFKSFFT